MDKIKGLKQKIKYAKSKLREFELKFLEYKQTHQNHTDLTYQANMAIYNANITNQKTKIFLLEQELAELEKQESQPQPQ